MEYERIHKVQTGMISPSKLRMKLMGSANRQKKKDDKSNTNSSRTSPSRLEDSEFVKNNLLNASSSEDPPNESANGLQSKELMSRPQLHSKGDTGNSSTVHPIRSNEDESLDYDSTSSFEFHKGERSLHHPSLTRSFSRPVSSKWNDAEKWIVSRQNAQQSNNPKRTNLQNQGNRAAANTIRAVPDSSAASENKPSVKRVDFCQPTTILHDFPDTKDLAEIDDADESSGVRGVRPVSMRDMGTEMTPIPSQEPSRSPTPASATTPLRSPTCSAPSTPRGGRDPNPTPADDSILDPSRGHHRRAGNGKQELSERELKVKTRREIVALGVQFGKTSIAAWASGDERDKGSTGNKNVDGGDDELLRAEYAERAAAWEEAEKTKHASRFKREEIRIEAWESQQRAKLEADMRKIEARIEQMRAHAQAKMVKKAALSRQKSEERRAAAEDRKARRAEKTAAEAERIRRTGRVPSSSPFVCCGW